MLVLNIQKTHLSSCEIQGTKQEKIAIIRTMKLMKAWSENDVMEKTRKQQIYTSQDEGQTHYCSFNNNIFILFLFNFIFIYF